MRFEKTSKMASYASFVSEKRDIIITSRNRNIVIYSLSTQKKIKTIENVRYAAHFCMDHDAEFLFCVTTEGVFYKFKIETWECVFKYKLRNPLGIDGDGNYLDIIKEIIFYDDYHLIAFTFNYEYILLINHYTGEVEQLYRQYDSEDYGETLNVQYNKKEHLLIEQIQVNRRKLNEYTQVIEKNNVIKQFS